MAGFPAEVVDAVVSVLCRLAFDLGVWGRGRLPLLVVAEEAHRYVPADKRMGFGPTRRSISRIAKEGRKYGVYLGLVTQRPAELDPTILSQCSSIFAMRMANEADHAIIRSAVSDAASSTLAALPSIGNREAIAFGEAVSMPMRVSFASLPPDRLPQNQLPTLLSTAVGGGRRRLRRGAGRPLALGGAAGALEQAASDRRRARSRAARLSLLSAMRADASERPAPALAGQVLDLDGADAQFAQLAARQAAQRAQGRPVAAAGAPATQSLRHDFLHFRCGTSRMVSRNRRCRCMQLDSRSVAAGFRPAPLNRFRKRKLVSSATVLTKHFGS